jgi:hypothetical protein
MSDPGREKSRAETLEEQGWTRQFTANEPRLSEAVEIYVEAGLEVHLEPMPPAEIQGDFPTVQADGECRKCCEGFEDQYKVIFTRPKGRDAGQETDLF